MTLIRRRCLECGNSAHPYFKVPVCIHCYLELVGDETRAWVARSPEPEIRVERGYN